MKSRSLRLTRLIWPAGMLGVLGMLGAHVSHGALPASATLRTFRFTYTTSIAPLPPEAQRVRIWVPLAQDHENQRVLSRQINVDRPYQIHQESAFGNEMLYVDLVPPVPDQLTIAIDYDVEVAGGAVAASGSAHPSALSEEERAFWLRHEPLMIIDETVTRLARETTAGLTDELAKARAIYDFVIARMSYDKTTPGWGQGDTARACLIGKGNCTDFHSLFISMARAVGIPARFVIGAPIPPEAEGDIPGYHCWAEFFIADHGWIPVDASEAWKHPERRDYYFGTRDPNKFLISTGRNLALVPPQSGAGVNMFVYPYVEVDQAPFQAIDTRFRFRDRQLEEGRT